MALEDVVSAIAQNWSIVGWRYANHVQFVAAEYSLDWPYLLGMLSTLLRYYSVPTEKPNSSTDKT